MRNVLKGLPPNCSTCCDDKIMILYGYDRGDRSAVCACPACSPGLTAIEMKGCEESVYRACRPSAPQTAQGTGGEVMRVTAAVKRALEAVERGEVVNTFTAKGNVFKTPKGVSPRICRELQDANWIKDEREPGKKKMGAYATHFKQRLTDAGRAALTAGEQRG